jgi:small-conductance mechanosensitive channel
VVLADNLWELVLDTETTGGRLVTSVLVVLGGVVAAMVASRVLARRADDALSRYYGRKVVRYVAAVAVLLVLAAVWRAFAGRIGVVLGFATAGVAFAMQEAIGALAGWFNIVSGRIFRVGDRIQMGGVRGDVIDITPLRTKVMEIGSASAGDSWVRGRQYTGRIVAISNKATFTEPVFNYSAAFQFIWEELSLPLAYGDDWETAEVILQEEVARASASAGAQRAIDEMTRRYPVPRAEIEPSVYVQASDDYVTLSARFVVPVRTARTVKDEVTRRVLDRLGEAGISVASSTLDVNVRQEPSAPPPGESDH